MAKRLGNVVSARYWDNEARKHAKRAAELDACADKRIRLQAARDGGEWHRRSVRSRKTAWKRQRLWIVVTVGNGGWAAHSNFRTARARGRPLMSENRWCEFRDEYVKSAAYHEAGHVVVAALQGMPLQEAGIRVDSEGSGVSHYWHRCPGDHATAPSDQLERERNNTAMH